MNRWPSQLWNIPPHAGMFLGMRLRARDPTRKSVPQDQQASRCQNDQQEIRLKTEKQVTVNYCCNEYPNYSDIRRLKHPEMLTATYGYQLNFMRAHVAI